jgi:ComF family protein
MLMKFSYWARDLVGLFFPDTCLGCGVSLMEQEHLICLTCTLNLPRTCFHLQRDNPVEKVFWGRVPVKGATSFLYFNKGGKVQRILHALKYRGRKEVGVCLGTLFGKDLCESHEFSSVQCIVPVPLHPGKEQKRGYNQSEMIGRGLSKSMGQPLITRALVRTVNTGSQTRKTRYNRWENVRDVFRVVDHDILRDKHILLVDDVLTTGATLEACAIKLLETEGTSVSMATLAYAQA